MRASRFVAALGVAAAILVGGATTANAAPSPSAVSHSAYDRDDNRGHDRRDNRGHDRGDNRRHDRGEDFRRGGRDGRWGHHRGRHHDGRWGHPRNRWGHWGPWGHRGHPRHHGYPHHHR
ncbi:hypothetical protein V1460_27975 [Streptomyces sp. SCSIO 30461]|uniref:hypothetical protein n=1 Tax=Streptomyces sp. SCSIO 30461 TaxID=3118085 RepID=UPI0030D594D5